jgi:hypothetical protein
MHAKDGSQSLQIAHATYGVEGAQMDVTQKVQAAVAGGQTNIRASNSFFGKDPAFGKVKTLSVTFVQRGVQYQTTAREGEQLSFAQPNVDQSNIAPIQEPQQRRLAPEGTFYLIERASLKTASGVVGFAPGTRVRVVQDKGETFSVTDGSTTFDVPADELTNDLDLAALVGRSDAKSQQTVAQWIVRQNAAGRQQHDDYIAMLDQQQREVDSARSAAEAAKPQPSGALDRGAYNQTEVVWPYPYWHHRHFIYSRRANKK